MQLFAAVNFDSYRGKFSDPIMIRRCCSVPKFLFEFFELVGNTATDLSIELQYELIKARQTFAHDKINDHYNLGYSNLLTLPKLANCDLFGTRDYFFENRLDWKTQTHLLPLSARVLRRKPRFNPRGNSVTHLTTPENWETNDILMQANRFEDLFRPTSADFVPSIENQITSP